MASHEFRTPLTVARSSAALIEQYPGTDQQSQRLKYLHYIHAAAKQLVDILEGFRAVGRIEGGNTQTHPADIDVPTLLGDVIANVQGLLKPSQTIDWQMQSAPQVCLDASLLRKILLNLPSNALKYSDKDSAVVVRGTCDGQQSSRRVQDQGVGISEEDQVHLFERFSRARNVSTVAGTGLGLFIIGKYLELMGGTIVLRSELNVGTAVTLTIPYEKHPAD